MEEMEFYDVKEKKKFKTTDYVVEARDTKRGKSHFAIADSPSGSYKCYKIISKAKFDELNG